MRLSAKNTALNNIISLLCLPIFSVIIAAPVLAQESEFSGQAIEIVAADDFTLSALFFPGLATAAGVLFLHDCQHSAKDYKPLYSALRQQGLNVLAPDLRGYGGSQSALYSDKKIRQQATDIVSYQGQVAALMLTWEKDLYLAYKHLKNMMNNNQEISVITTGCSSNQAIYLAEKMPLKSFVMLTPELSNDDKERFRHLADMPIYLLSAQQQTDAMLNVQELFQWSADKHSILQIFKGDGSSYDLLRQQVYLNEHIATWLHSSFEKNSVN